MTLAQASFQLTRSFRCTPDKLWHLLTDPKAREVWSGPSDDDVLTADRADLREGGQDLHRCGPAEAPAYTVETRWYRLDAPQAACFSETVDAEGMRIGTSLVTYQITAEDGGTVLTVDVTTVSFVGEEALGDFKVGWTSALDRLPSLLVPVA